MPEATLKFNIPEDMEELKDALHASNYRSVIEQVLYRLRRIEKDSNAIVIGIDDMRAIIQNEMVSHGVDLL